MTLLATHGCYLYTVTEVGEKRGYLTTVDGGPEPHSEYTVGPMSVTIRNDDCECCDCSVSIDVGDSADGRE